MRMVCNFATVIFAVDHTVVTEVIEMRQTFSYGVPSLAVRKIIPAITVDVP